MLFYYALDGLCLAGMLVGYDSCHVGAQSGSIGPPEVR